MKPKAKYNEVSFYVLSANNFGRNDSQGLHMRYERSLDIDDAYEIATRDGFSSIYLYANEDFSVKDIEESLKIFASQDKVVPLKAKKAIAHSHLKLVHSNPLSTYERLRARIKVNIKAETARKKKSMEQNQEKSQSYKK